MGDPWVTTLAAASGLLLLLIGAGAAQTAYVDRRIKGRGYLTMAARSVVEQRRRRWNASPPEIMGQLPHPEDLPSSSLKGIS